MKFDQVWINVVEDSSESMEPNAIFHASTDIDEKTAKEIQSKGYSIGEDGISCLSAACTVKL